MFFKGGGRRFACATFYCIMKGMPIYAKWQCTVASRMQMLAWKHGSRTNCQFSFWRQTLSKSIYKKWSRIVKNWQFEFSTQSILKNRPNSSSPSSFLVHCTHSHSEHISHHDIHFCEWCIRVISNIYHCIQTLWMDWNFETLPPLTSKQRF